MNSTSPIMQQNWNNATQIGAIMHNNGTEQMRWNYLNAVGSQLFGVDPNSIPAGYSYANYMQERELAAEQLMWKPVHVAANFAGNAILTAATYSNWGEIMARSNNVFVSGLGTVAKHVTKSVSAPYTTLVSSLGQRVGYLTGRMAEGATKVVNLGAQQTLNFTGLGSFVDASKITSKITDFIGGIGWKDPNAAQAIMSASLTDAEKATQLSSLLGKEVTANGLKKAVTEYGEMANSFANAKSLGGAGARFVGKVGEIATQMLNPAFLAKQYLLSTAMDYATEGYQNYSTRKNLEREILAKGGRILRFGDADSSQGIEGGFTKAQRKELTAFIDRLAANQENVIRDSMFFGSGANNLFGGHKAYTENLKEMKAMFSVATDMGLLDMSKSLDEVEKRFKSFTDIVKKVGKITGKTKGELAMALASISQTEGRFDIDEAGTSLKRKVYAAASTGAELQTVMMESQMGAQMGMQMGLGRAVGADLMVHARQVAGRMIRSNIFDRKDLMIYGGEQGLISRIANSYGMLFNNKSVNDEFAMAFDLKTGKFDWSRLNTMLDPTTKKERLRAMDYERTIAANSRSINEWTGREEIGGVLNGRRDAVRYAMQRGDIDMETMFGMVRGLLNTKESYTGKKLTGLHLQRYLTDLVGYENAKWFKPLIEQNKWTTKDAKEEVAAARKLLEQRYNSEYNRANEMGIIAGATGIATILAAPIGLGLLGAGGGLALGLGAALTLGAGYFGSGKNPLETIQSLFTFGKSYYLSHGSNAMTKPMAEIYEMGGYRAIDNFGKLYGAKEFFSDWTSGRNGQGIKTEDLYAWRRNLDEKSAPFNYEHGEFTNDFLLPRLEKEDAGKGRRGTQVAAGTVAGVGTAAWIWTSAKTGAAAGTVVGGPGLGTAAGALIAGTAAAAAAVWAASEAYDSLGSWDVNTLRDIKDEKERNVLAVASHMAGLISKDDLDQVVRKNVIKNLAKDNDTKKIAASLMRFHNENFAYKDKISNAEANVIMSRVGASAAALIEGREGGSLKAYAELIDVTKRSKLMNRLYREAGGDTSWFGFEKEAGNVAADEVLKIAAAKVGENTRYSVLKEWLTAEDRSAWEATNSNSRKLNEAIINSSRDMKTRVGFTDAQYQKMTPEVMKKFFAHAYDKTGGILNNSDEQFRMITNYLAYLTDLKGDGITKVSGEVVSGLRGIVGKGDMAEAMRMYQNLSMDQMAVANAQAWVKDMKLDKDEEAWQRNLAADEKMYRTEMLEHARKTSDTMDDLANTIKDLRISGGIAKH